MFSLEFSSYNSSGNSSSSFDPSMLTRSFENENKENTESPLINQVRGKFFLYLHKPIILGHKAGSPSFSDEQHSRFTG